MVAPIIGSLLRRSRSPQIRIMKPKKNVPVRHCYIILYSPCYKRHSYAYTLAPSTQEFDVTLKRSGFRCEISYPCTKRLLYNTIIFDLLSTVSSPETETQKRNITRCIRQWFNVNASLTPSTRQVNHKYFHDRRRQTSSKLYFSTEITNRHLTSYAMSINNE